MPVPIVLWGAPRTVSTAFERMMRERGDHEVWFEPFAAHYYFSAERTSARFDGEVEARPEHELPTILDRLLDVADRSPLFVKDMAYHVAAEADEAFLGRFANTFIVRHPRASLPSLARVWPDFTLDEAGFSALRRLFDRAAEVAGGPPPVIDGDDLCTDPGRVVEAWCKQVGIPYRPDALTWRPGRPAEWEPWAEWVHRVERSEGLGVGAPATPRDLSAPLDDDHLEAVAQACLDDYHHLDRHRL